MWRLLKYGLAFAAGQLFEIACNTARRYDR